MFKRAGTVFNQRLLRRIQTQTSTQAQVPIRRNGAALAAGSAFAAASFLWYSTSEKIHNDPLIGIEDPASVPTHKPMPLDKPSDPETIYSLVWGSNKNKVLLPTDATSDEHIRSPVVARWLDGVALRDLQFEQSHAACIDARGDVYQWGDGFFGSSSQGVHTPKLTLRGKNIIQVQLTADKLYALSASGKIYVLSTDAMQQELKPGSPTPSSDSWWGTGWLWGEDETIDFAEVTPASPFSWRESVVSISAGKNHLLALTSLGRVFGHPINKEANHYGQLGFRKFSIPDASAAVTKTPSHLDVELTPKSISDPFMNASRSVRVTSTSASSHNLANVDDKNIRFCTQLYEVPALKGIQVAEIAAGSRTSFVRTPTGRVLGWGANEFGQIGLGANVALDTITVPTEVVLWRFVGSEVRSRCTGMTAGGDLTGFIVERQSHIGPSTTDLLMCGNGQYGGLGNSIYTTSQGNPIRVKNLSGLVQYNESIQDVEPVNLDEIIISPTGHVLLTLDSSADSGGVGGQDLMVWGRGREYELGNGKRSNAVNPMPLQAPDGEERFMLFTKNAKEVKDLHGKVWKYGVKVKQQVAAGYENSVVYWKVVL